MGKTDLGSDQGRAMNLLRLLALAAQASIALGVVWASTRIWLSRQRARNAERRSEIEAHACYEAALRHARLFMTGGLGGNRWADVQGPRRLIVGADAFIFSAPNALREFVFSGPGCSIAHCQASSGFVDRDWIVITGQANSRQIQLAISDDNLPEIWQALTSAGVAYGHGPAA
jgi:hypothetical protein